MPLTKPLYHYMKPAITLFLCCLFALPAVAQTKNFIDRPYIEVNGSADTLITPNEIFIRIVISEKDSRDKVPVEATERKMIDALKAMGINTETDLTNSDLLSNYRYYLLKQKDIIKSKEYILKVPDATTASKVFIRLEDLEISNAAIDHTNHTALDHFQTLCRSRAVADAKARALAFTSPLGQQPGAAIYIADMDRPAEAPVLAQVTGNTPGLSNYGYDKAKYLPPKIEFEKIRVQASVHVVFELR